MPYGVRRGVKQPGDFGFADVFGLASAAGAGIFAALVTDFSQQGEASALFRINQWVVAAGSLLGFGDVPLWGVMAGLVAIGAGSVFYFQPVTRPGAFAQGFGLLAALMTATPTSFPSGLGPLAAEPGGIEPAILAQPGGPAIIETAAAIENAGVHAIEGAVTETYALRLAITFPNGAPRDFDSLVSRGKIRGRLHNEGARETYDLFRTAGATRELKGNVLTIVAGVPARAAATTLWVRIECEGYAIEEQSAKAERGRPLDWSIAMRPSKTPLYLQRLGKSYWF
jgi:hypothetical protein